MYFSAILLGLSAAASVRAAPVPVTLDPTAVAQAQVRDATATRAFSGVPIVTADGRCLSVDPTSGDFRENLTPITAVACSASSPNQAWDVITAGTHISGAGAAGQALIVSTLTNACLNFDPRRAAGNQVLLFSCGGRADGSGVVATSQLFAFSGNAGPLPLVPQNGASQVCLTVDANGALDQAACTAQGQQLFSFGAPGKSTGASASSSASTSSTVAKTSSSATSTSTTSTTKSTSTSSSTAKSTTSTPAPSSAPAPEPEAPVTVTTTVFIATTVTATASPSASPPALNDVAVAPKPASTSTPASTSKTASAAPAVVSGAGGTLNAADVAQSQARDDTATRALQGVAVKTTDGGCLSVSATTGDFRENLIPVEVAACDGSAGQRWDVLTAGVHNNVPGAALVVSALTQGCLNFDPRRAAGDQVNLFSCGGRADGSGQVATSQLFPFSAAKVSGVPLQPQNGNGAVCLEGSTGSRLGEGACGAGEGLFSFV